ncbi:Gfo/Idh/MocA family oxidoreductase [Umezawaea sp. Da 62-37]|uniref:Gfo/Idh/MocA family oxidoreductase n=1 Tax=Umezawaea sp. Da 62-37 TaxID=3075927 RepID=UPI0028F6CE34|nr:Gfo/Idh/MocA family oxidoreductase [Umezawaea sp. Da 62-37]WNV88988.1 Gfo/Idh/MocA family oxidoreductase [Umezawaea sp. Da 62-37]
MLRTLIIGLGRAGAGLHLAVLRRLRAGWEWDAVFDPAPVIAVDPRAHGASLGKDVLVTASIAEAAARLDPARTVVHVCTPPAVRLDLLRELAGLGFREIIVEKPITTDRAALAEILNLADAEELRLAVVAPWLASALTARLVELVANGGLGALRSVEIMQSKPRMGRSLANDGHPTAFDVEPPHSLGVCLRLAGAARLVDARLSDMTIGSTVIPNMGSAELVLRHEAATSRIVSDLASPVRERRIELDFAGGHVIGHYPGSADDHYAQLHVAAEGGPASRDVFPDDALTAYMRDTYLGFQQGKDFRDELAIGCQVAELIAEAKDLCLTGTEAASVG